MLYFNSRLYLVQDKETSTECLGSRT